ncbi:carboxymuconolactone decarboxylase family protein [Herbaspirillum sp. RTI4]|uniref:carboxymuconolactone decarboxylase family protein n=1 Tax=Herbaspirillum sp. RTI4 TaxID=3048640 RepID=UPI002AB50CC0|nr:carboxymuconolactone decarboxylase family protein [Herbaspirillum sp. RTI4]MDY7579218.1 carboxymuconolactone decarboxylase family protein [Herbaspirillum sp. RTI4]MEA9982649.1 carboxymuconolactone decarboxylase family protein [Herbaspirillum sp. RTI4]
MKIIPTLALAGALCVSLQAVAQDRMPLPAMSELNEVQRQAAQDIINGPRKALYGPFIPLLRSPELLDRSSKMGEYLRYKSAIGNKLSELVILIVARHWTQQVEWYLHQPIALKVGIKQEVIDAIADGRTPTGLSEDEQIVYDFSTEINTNKGVSDVTYQKAKTRFGDTGVIDMLGVNGYYTFLAIVMNGTRTANPDTKVTPLKAFGQ